MQEELAKKTEQYIRQENLIVSGDNVLVGLSGGADSVCLLLLLHQLCKRLSFLVGAFHVNHGIRGEQADADERFSEKLCEKYKIPFFSVRVDVPAYAKEQGMGLEEAGRQVRYREAARICEAHGYTKVALAHHQGDVAETFLFHLFRGSSTGGLASIPAKRGNIIRPLLFCEKNEILDYLGKLREDYCTDITNEDREYARNRIRHVILPEAEKINEGAKRHIAQAAAEFSELEEYLQAAAKELCQQAEKRADGCLIPVGILRGAPRMVQAKAVYALLSETAGSACDLTRTHVERILSLTEKQSGKRVMLPYGIIAERSFDRLILKKTGKTERTREFTVEIPGEYPTEREGVVLRFRCFPCQKNEQIPKNECTKWFDYGKIKGTLKLRTRREGDSLGMLCGSKSLKSVFTEHKIEKEARDSMLLLADDAQILWVPGIRSNDAYRVDASTVTILEVQMHKGESYEG